MSVKQSVTDVYQKIKAMKEENGGNLNVIIHTTVEQGAFPTANATYWVLYVYGKDESTKLCVTRIILEVDNVPASMAADKSLVPPDAAYTKLYGTINPDKKTQAHHLRCSKPQVDDQGRPIENRAYQAVRDKLTELGMHHPANNFANAPDEINEHWKFVYIFESLNTAVEQYIVRMSAAYFNPSSQDHATAKEMFGESPKSVRGIYMHNVRNADLKVPKACINFKFTGEGHTRKLETKVRRRVASNRSKSGFASSVANIETFANPTSGEVVPLNYKTMPQFFMPYGSLYSMTIRFTIAIMQAGIFFKATASDICFMPVAGGINAHLGRDEDDAALDDTVLDASYVEQYNPMGANPSPGDGMMADPPISFTGGSGIPAANKWDGQV